MHYWRELRGLPGSFARLSDREDTRTAVVFVHGYYGDALKTWADFQGEVDRDGAPEVFATSDLYFYKYDSTRNVVRGAAEAFAAALKRIYPIPAAHLFTFSVAAAGIVQQSRGIPREGAPGYRDLVLVGHSMGGVVIRELAYRTIRYGIKGGLTADQVKPAAVALFGPAQYGFKLSEAVASAISFHGILAFLNLLYVANTARAYNDLAKGSKVLDGIEEETKAVAAELGDKARCLQASTVWGQEEWVVFTRDYPVIDRSHDPLVPGRGHLDVCKPSRDYPIPVTWVADAITRARQPL